MQKPLKKIGRTQSLYMEAMEAIKQSIFRGDFPPGQPLPSEKALTEQLGVSRPVVREALRALQIQGLLDIRRGNKGGTYVNDLNQISFKNTLNDLIRLRRVSIADLSRARLFIEPEVFRLAAVHASADELKALRQITIETEQTTDPKQRIDLAILFHRNVAKACGNFFYILIMDTMMDFLDKFQKAINPEMLAIHDDQRHTEILKALCERDGDRAAALLKDHIEDLSENMIRLEKKWLETVSENSD
jgi:DNA-binding FadR family transcriptional regulator